MRNHRPKRLANLRAEGLEDRRLLTISFRPATFYPVTDGNTSLLSGDFNGDGKADLVTISPQFNGLGEGGTVTALLGDGRGGFSASVDSPISLVLNGAAEGDFNGDGKLDLVTTALSPATGQPVLQVLLGNGDGTFREGGSAPGVENLAAITAADFNGDGVEDFAVGYGASVDRFTPSSGPVLVYLGHRDGTVSVVGLAANLGTTNVAPALVTGDFNGDGKPDLAGASDTSDAVRILLGNGDGTFRDAGASPIADGTTALAVADLNGDGKADLVALNLFSGGVASLIGAGDGTFSGGPGFRVGLGRSAALAVGDFDGDGKVDVAATNAPLNQVAVAPGDGAGGFGAVVSTPAPGSAFATSSPLVALDLDGDGRADLATSAQSPPGVGVLLSGGGSTSGDGPRVTAAVVTPRSGQVRLTLGDDAAGLDAASLADASNYQLIGPLSGLGRKLAKITGISVSPATADGSTTVTLTIGGGRPLPHGRYLLTLKSGGIRDRAGRSLDGEFTSGLPSGDGVAGGDFQARFRFNQRRLQPLAPVAARSLAAKKAARRG